MPGELRTYVYRGGERGDGRRRSMVFVHGAGHDHSVWNLQARYFAHHGWSVLAPDLPGHGASGGEPLPSVEDLAAWLLALLDREQAEGVHLVGHSMGSLVALEAAARAPQRVAGLALVGSSVPMPVAPILLEAARDERQRAHAMINQWSFSAAGRLGAGAVPGMNAPQINLRLMERQRPGILYADLAACNGYLRGPQAAGEVRCRTLLVCGARDQMTPPRNADTLRGALCRAADLRIETIADCGHAIMAEKPEPLTDALIDWSGG